MVQSPTVSASGDVERVIWALSLWHLVPRLSWRECSRTKSVLDFGHVVGVTIQAVAIGADNGGW